MTSPMSPAEPALLPCPFCGGEAALIGGDEVGCLACGLWFAMRDYSEAIAAWNRRDERTLAAVRIATERETVERLGDKYALVVANAERYMRAIKALAQFKDGKTLFEGSPTQDQDCYQAWRELNDSGVALTTAIRQLSPPDPAPEPTQETER